MRTTDASRRAPTYPLPTHRALRGYALDPSLAQSLQTAALSEITLRIPWEPLDPGPRGEYLEVIDFDPSSKAFYAPVDLDHPRLLAQNGLAPSEGTPQFHQQMVYAVASLTINRFERALGRKALWAPGPGRHLKDDSNFTQRLRIYPHALRDANAYYSPEKKALLFGYFSAPDNDVANHVPGGAVFTCLSHDIIAHETAHALLDGMHRRLIVPTNPDMLAFHEAFADVVALFQHFTFPEILQHEIANVRGALQNQETLLGQMAGQFGRATGLRGALRDAIGAFDKATGRWIAHKPDPLELQDAVEPHERGAILVAAIFDAFLRIYSSRTADLIRLYTGGTGVLPAGAIHPDLVVRLADEARKTADHVLSMCVRALDYCPPLDLTFGEYLRAIITADLDLYPEDVRDYRIAFVESFRQRGIYPRDIRTLSVDSLRWRQADADELQPSASLGLRIEGLKEYAHRMLYAQGREELFFEERETRKQVHAVLADQFKKGRTGERDAAFLGLSAHLPFEVHAVHFAVRSGPDGHPHYQLIAQLMQGVKLPVSKGSSPPASMRFEGGSTVLIDVRRSRIDYCIRKAIGSKSRAARQTAFLRRRVSSLRAAYFGATAGAGGAEPFAHLHRGL